MLRIQTCIRYEKNLVLEKKNTSLITKVEYDETWICLLQSLLLARGVVRFTRLWGRSYGVGHTRAL